MHDVRDEQVHLAARQGLTAGTARQAATGHRERYPSPLIEPRARFRSRPDRDRPFDGTKLLLWFRRHADEPDADEPDADEPDADEPDAGLEISRLTRA